MTEFKVGQEVRTANSLLDGALHSSKYTLAVKYYYLFTKSDGEFVVRAVRADGSDFAESFDFIFAIPKGER